VAADTHGRAVGAFGHAKESSMTAIDHVPALNGAEGSDRLPGPIGVVRSSYNEAWLDDVYAQAIGNLHGGERGAWMSDKVCRAIAAAHRGGVPRPRATRSSPLRTRRGKAWTARSVRRMVVNEGYVGTTGYPAVIDAERHERVAAAVTRMDPAAVLARTGGRRPTDDDYLLRGVAFCLRCGASLFTRRYASGRHYLCSAVRQALGTCDAPRVPAAHLEAEVLGHLVRFVGNLKEWLRGRAAELQGEREALGRAADTERDRLAAAERSIQRMRGHWRRHSDAGADDLADLVLREIGRAEAERDEQAQALEDARARAAEWTATPELDGALDYYRELRDLIDGRIGRARAAGEVNAELRALLHGIWVDVEERVYSAGQPPERQMVVQAVARDGRLGSVTSGALLALPASLPVPALCFDDASSASPLTFV
jgi:hypothetical protein